MTGQFDSEAEKEFVDKLVPLIFRSWAATSAIELLGVPPVEIKGIVTRLALACGSRDEPCRFDENLCNELMLLAAVILSEIWRTSTQGGHHILVRIERFVVRSSGQQWTFVAAIKDTKYEFDMSKYRIFKFFLRSGLECAEKRNAQALAEELKQALDMTWMRQVEEIKEVSKKELEAMVGGDVIEHMQKPKLERLARNYFYRILELYILATLVGSLERRLVTQTSDGEDAMPYNRNPSYGLRMKLFPLTLPPVKIDIGGYRFFYGGGIQSIARSLGCQNLEGLFGLPDLVVATPAGKVFVIEVKLRESSSLSIRRSVEQVSFHADELRRCIKEVIPVVAYYRLGVSPRAIRKPGKSIDRLGAKLVELKLDGVEEELSSIVLGR